VVVRFHPYVGGVENTVLDVGRRLAARGHEVRVVCADEPAGSPAQVEEAPGITVIRLPWKGKIGNTNLARGLGAALRRERPDVIHTHIPTALFADAAAAASRALGVPLVLTYHNDLTGEGVKGALAGVYNRLVLPRLLARSDRVVTTSEAMRVPHLAADDPKITPIPWGVDEELFRPPADGGAPAEAPELVLGFLSLLDAHHRYKGLEVLLRALAVLRGEGLPVRLRLGGAGEEQGRYREIAARLGIADAVDFLGFVPAAELPAFYGACHAFALPSTDGRREGFGLVLLEAMACGRPVVTTPIVGMAADIHAYGAGTLVPPGDAAALARAIRRLGEDRAGLAAQGLRARRLVEERYNWTRVTDDYERVFREVREAAEVAARRRAPARAV
jgi:glycosyltransferase involved in cell wall biosynthesis